MRQPPPDENPVPQPDFSPPVEEKPDIFFFVFFSLQ
jgi:hypothetical protein